MPLIDLEPIEHRSKHTNPTKILIAILISQEIGSIDRNSGKTNFLRNKAILQETPQSIVFYE